MKKSFLGLGRSAISLICRPRSVEEALAMAAAGAAAGADGVTVELHEFPPASRTTADFRAIVSSVDLPFLFTDYRYDVYLGADDEARMASLLRAAEAGAEFVDVMADLYDPSPLQISRNEAAAQRQKRTIDEVHARGAKAIMSSHILDAARTAEQVLAQLREQEARGADVVKLVAMANTSDELAESVRTLGRLQAEMKTPWVYLCGGTHAHLQRFLGTRFGCAIEFAVTESAPDSPYQQPTIADFKSFAELNR